MSVNHAAVHLLIIRLLRLVMSVVLPAGTLLYTIETANDVLRAVRSVLVQKTSARSAMMDSSSRAKGLVKINVNTAQWHTAANVMITIAAQHATLLMLLTSTMSVCSKRTV